MPTARKLKPGTLAVTDGGEIYVALGVCTGKPASMYRRPDHGYLYVFLMSSFYLDFNSEEKENLQNPAWVANEIRERARTGIDGNACYTEKPKRFDHILQTLDLSKENLPDHLWGLRPDLK